MYDKYKILKNKASRKKLSPSFSFTKEKKKTPSLLAPLFLLL